jgi:hypothetical protein
MLTPDQIEAFYLGQRLPEQTLEEIERSLDDPESLVAQISRKSAELTRQAFDPAMYTVVDDDEVQAMKHIKSRSCMSGGGNQCRM